MQMVKQSSTAYPLMFLMIDSADHISAKTGLTVTVTLSKAGGSFASPTGAVSEVANGWYKVAGNATDTATLGSLVLHATASGADPCDKEWDVVAFDPQVATNLGLSALPTTAAGASGGLPLGVDSSGRVDVLKINGTSQTARDLGASVLLSSGTGTGQLDFTSGVVKSSLVQILGTALTETSGQIAAAFKKFFDKATPTGTINSLPDAVAGATNGLFIAGTNAATVVTTSFTTTFTGSLTGSVASVSGAVGSISGITFPTNFSSLGIGGTGKITGVVLVDTLTAYTGNTVQTGDSYARLGTPAGASVSADIAADKAVNDAVKLKTDNLPSDPADASDVAGAFSTVNSTLATIASYVDTEVAAIKAKTDQLVFTVANQVDVNVIDWKGATAPAMTGDAFARLGAPAGASVSADVAALNVIDTAVKVQTDKMVFTVSNQLDVNVITKTGFILAATGLDTVTASEPSGKPTTFAGWVMWLVQHFRHQTFTEDTKTILSEAGATITVQPVSDNGTTQEVGVIQ